MVKLFVGGFPLEITEMQLAQLIAPHGNISTIKIVRDRQTRKCKGYAFVEMATEEDAAQVAAALDGEDMQGRQLSVRIAEEKPAKPAPRSNFNRSGGNYNKNYAPRPDRPSYNSNNNNSNNNSGHSKRPRLSGGK